VLGACHDTPSRDHRSATPAAGELNASAGQFRFDEGTRDVRTGITNNSSEPIVVTSARISWDGFDWAEAKLPKEPVPPHQTAAFISRFGRANCTTKPSRTRLLAVINGARRDLPLHLDEPGLFARLRTTVCAEQRLTDAASLTMSIGGSVVHDQGVPAYASTVTLRRRHASGEPVTVVDLGGSVLFDVLPRDSRRLRPVRLTSNATSLTIPIRVGPTRRCSAHARGNASQPFLFSVFTRTGHGPVHRSIRVPDKATQQRLLGQLDRYCKKHPRGN
jgi:hypothetical protein